MPTVLRRTGLDFVRDGETIEPRREVHTCEDCGDPAIYGLDASLLKRKPGRWYCGYREGKPVCVGKGKADGMGV